LEDWSLGVTNIGKPGASVDDGGRRCTFFHQPAQPVGRLLAGQIAFQLLARLGQRHAVAL